ncbi:hypothetical protein [Pararhodospirillum oryzae]|uniref:Uncharacterized protein n=1 Tax=Pararhodospirillum oryzae TaxID=478448 RepID=A0A512H7M1_9PROT|nr:hypothetical protein [Pararhodospirillum oryzae]GEO81424.1 hypothetical protein ROR02_15550 [Pararhodospirillum oryzae]
MDKLIEFIWASMSGVAGNAIYESIKKILGEEFDKLLSFVKTKNRNKFNSEITNRIETNNCLKKELEAIYCNQENSAGSNHIRAETKEHGVTVIQIGDNCTNNTNTKNKNEDDYDETLKVSVLSADGLKLTYPKKMNFENPVMVVSVYNEGNKSVSINDIIVQFSDGTEGTFFNLKNSIIDAGQSNTWFIPNGHPICVETGEFEFGMKTIKILKADRDSIESIGVKTHRNNIFKLRKKDWSSIN